MKAIFKFICVFAAALALNANLSAQSPVAPKNSAQTDLLGNSDEAVDQIIAQLNALPLDFKIASAEMLPRSLANLRKHAALLKKMPGAANLVIGVHTFAVGDEAQNKIITQKRANYLKTELIKLGVSASALSASGYGSSQPVASNATEEERKKNRRVEYTRAEMTFDFDDIFETQKDSADSTANKTAETVKLSAALEYKANHTIFAGKGFGSVVLGATREQIEASFGKPDEFVDEDAGMFRIYEANYFLKGVKIEYDDKTKIATSILLIGEGSKTEAFKAFKLFAGATDKQIRWGASPAEVIAAYGKPVKEEMMYNPNVNKDYEYITYQSAAFGFHENRLTYIANSATWGK